MLVYYQSFPFSFDRTKKKTQKRGFFLLFSNKPIEETKEIKFRWKEGNLVATLCIQKKDEGQDKKSFSYSVCVCFFQKKK